MGHHGHGLKRNLAISIVLNLTITIAEVIGGLILGSLALLSDSLHNLGDSMSLLASYSAVKLGKRWPIRTYKFYI